MSAVWAHCRTARDNKDPAVKYCNYCTDLDTPIYFSSISSNMRKYLESKHAIVVEVTPSQIQNKITSAIAAVIAMELEGNRRDCNTMEKQRSGR